MKFTWNKRNEYPLAQHLTESLKDNVKILINRKSVYLGEIINFPLSYIFSYEFNNLIAGTLSLYYLEKLLTRNRFRSSLNFS